LAKKPPPDEPPPDDAGHADALVGLASSVVAAYAAKNQILPADLPSFLRTVHQTMVDLINGHSPAEEAKQPAISIKKSVTDDYIICLHDGKKLTMLRRYLRTHYNQSAEEYRRQFSLPPDYPMVAPSYARLRSAFAKKIGLGRGSSGRKKK
jgi:predicted transcriptional regulator